MNNVNTNSPRKNTNSKVNKLSTSMGNLKKDKKYITSNPSHSNDKGVKLGNIISLAKSKVKEREKEKESFSQRGEENLENNPCPNSSGNSNVAPLNILSIINVAETKQTTTDDRQLMKSLTHKVFSKKSTSNNINNTGTTSNTLTSLHIIKSIKSESKNKPIKDTTGRGDKYDSDNALKKIEVSPFNSKVITGYNTKGR
jgi:hypothetical protein